MPILLIEASQVVRYAKEIEVSAADATRFRDAFESRDPQAIQDVLSEWIDTRQDATDDENYEVLNALIDGEQMAH